MTSMLKLLPKTRLIEHPELLKSIVAEAAQPGAAVPKAEAAVTTLMPVLDPKLGEGLNRLKKGVPEFSETLKARDVIKTGVLAALDKFSRDAAPDDLRRLVDELKEPAKKPETLAAKLKELRPKLVQP